ncbi:MAG: type IV toxin-antitoxin system AbiEi family antitoxin [Myxococcota bacterium]
MTSEARLLVDAQAELERLLGGKARSLRSAAPVDMLLRVGRWTLVVDAKTSSASLSVADAAQTLLRYRRAHAEAAIPVVVVPFMGPAGQAVCNELGVSWLDLSGNADIRGEGLVVHVEGRPNNFKTAGRPSSAFAPKAARVARVLLVDPTAALSHRELVMRTELGGGYVSRTVKRLEAEGYVVRDSKTGKVKVTEPASMLRDWRASYRFDKHEIRRAHVAVSGDEDLLAIMDHGLSKLSLRYAATGLSAAWLLASFAGYRTATFFVERHLTDAEAKKMSLRWTERGANVWVVVPNDEGVYYDAKPRSGRVPCVHPVQAYLDLKGHPERAEEAAQALEQRFLTWQRG